MIVIDSPDGSKDGDIVVSPSKSHPSEVHEVVSQHPDTSVSEVKWFQLQKQETFLQLNQHLQL